MFLWLYVYRNCFQFQKTHAGVNNIQFVPKAVCNIAVNYSTNFLSSTLTRYLLSNWPLNALKVILRKQYFLEFQVFEKNSTVMIVCALGNVHKLRRRFLMTFDPHTGYSFWDRLYNFLHKFTWVVFLVQNKLVNSGKFMDNCWISCQIYYDLIIINL